MSGELVGLVLTGVRDMDPGRKLVLVVLAEAAQSPAKPHSWLSVATIMARAGLTTDRSVRRHLTALLQAGWITTEKRSKGGRPTTYRISVERMREDNPDMAVRVSGSLVDANPDMAVRKPGHSCPMNRSNRTDVNYESSRNDSHAIAEDWMPTKRIQEAMRRQGHDVGPKVEAFRNHVLAHGMPLERPDAAFLNFCRYGTIRRPKDAA